MSGEPKNQSVGVALSRLSVGAVLPRLLRVKSQIGIKAIQDSIITRILTVLYELGNSF